MMVFEISLHQEQPANVPRASLGVCLWKFNANSMLVEFCNLRFSGKQTLVASACRGQKIVEPAQFHHACSFSTAWWYSLVLVPYPHRGFHCFLIIHQSIHILTTDLMSRSSLKQESRSQHDLLRKTCLTSTMRGLASQRSTSGLQRLHVYSPQRAFVCKSLPQTMPFKTFLLTTCLVKVS